MLQRLSLLLMATFLSFSPAKATLETHAPIIMGYVSTWSLQSNPILQSPGINHATHLMYSFLQISKSGLCVERSGTRYLEEFKSLKSERPNLKTILSIGGWGGSKYFSDVAATAASRSVFVESCLGYLSKYDFDGIDIDWEFPISGGLPGNHYRSDDASNQVRLVREFKKQLRILQLTQKRVNPYLIGVAVSGEKTQSQVFDVGGLAREVDWFGVMAYDLCHEMGCYHSALTPYDRIHSYAQETIDDLLRRGARRDQLVFGLAFYGYLWDRTLGVHQTAKTIAFRERGALRLNPNTDVLDMDTPASLRIKTRAALNQNLGGVLIWDLPSDDFELSTLNQVHSEAYQTRREFGI